MHQECTCCPTQQRELRSAPDTPVVELRHPADSRRRRRLMTSQLPSLYVYLRTILCRGDRIFFGIFSRNFVFLGSELPPWQKYYPWRQLRGGGAAAEICGCRLGAGARRQVYLGPTGALAAGSSGMFILVLLSWNIFLLHIYYLLDRTLGFCVFKYIFLSIF